MREMVIVAGLSRLIGASLRFVAWWLVPLGLAGLVMAAWTSGLWSLAGRQAAARWLTEVQVRGTTPEAVLGRNALMQNDGPQAADERHVRLYRHQGDWWISNASGRRGLLLLFEDGTEMRTDRLVAGRSDEVLLSFDRPNDTRIALTEIGPNSVRIALTGRRGADLPVTAEYQVALTAEGAQLLGSDARASTLVSCGRTSTLAPLEAGLERARRWSRNLFAERSEYSFIKFGGRHLCIVDGVISIPIPDIPFDVIRLNFMPKRGFLFAPGWSRAAVIKRDRDEVLFGELEHQLCLFRPCNRARVTGFVAGRTHYAIHRGKSGMDLRIVPVAYGHRKVCPQPGDATCNGVSDGRVHAAWREVESASELWSESAGSGSAPVLLRWLAAVTSRSGLPLLGAILICPVIFLLVSHLSRRDADAAREDRSNWLRCALAALAIMFGLATWRGFALFDVGEAVPVTPVPLLVSWAAMMLTVFFAFGSGLHLRLFIVVLTAIVALGHYGLAAIAFASNDLRFARFYNEATFGLGLFAAALSIAAVLPTGFYSRLAERCVRTPAGAPDRRIPRGLLVLLALATLNLTLWLGLGTQTGIANLYQPSEVAKVIAVMVLAALVAIVLGPQLGAVRRRSVPAMLTALFGMIALLGVFLIVPVFKHDFSPFLIQALTAMLSFLTIAVLHRSAVWSEARLVSERLSESPTRISAKPLTAAERIRRRAGSAWRFIWSRGIRLHPFEVLGCTIAALVLLTGLGSFVYAKNNPDQVKELLESHIGSSINVPASRILSWLELLPRPGEKPASVTLPDTGQQVMRSRTVMLAAPCQIDRQAWRASAPAWIQRLTPSFVLQVIDEVDQEIGRSCAVGGASRNEQVQAAALNIPEVHSDFIGSWLLVVLGRDGVLFLMCLQIVFVLLGLLAALSLARWVQTARISHAAASLVAYTIVGLTIVLALQWALSWGNTFGVTPVVGQPATFLSAGRSHLLSFGLGMVIAVMVGLRLTRARGRLQLDPLPPVPRRFARSLIVRWREARA